MNLRPTFKRNTISGIFLLAVGKIYSALVYGRVCEIIDGKEQNEDDINEKSILES